MEAKIIQHTYLFVVVPKDLIRLEEIQADFQKVDLI